jgi:hypothetical protein
MSIFLTKTYKERAEEIVQTFYNIMPFRDSKLYYRSIDEKIELVQEVELVTAQQCAIKYVEGVIEALGSHQWQNRLISEDFIEILSELRDLDY